MSQTTSLQSPPAQPATFDLDDFERRVRTSPALARALVFGLPSLGLIASLAAGLPPFAAMMAGCFLLATGLVCRKAVAAFTGRTLRLLVASRLVIILVLAALLLCTSGSAWVGLVSAVLLWLTADRLLGRRALHDLWKLTRKGS